MTFEQGYPNAATEFKIVYRTAVSLVGRRFCFLSASRDWADIIRKTFFDGGVDEVISTRRLIHIINAYAIWNDKQKITKYVSIVLMMRLRVPSWISMTKLTLM